MLVGRNKLLLIRGGIAYQHVVAIQLRRGQVETTSSRDISCVSVGLSKHCTASYDKSAGCLMRLLLIYLHAAGYEA